MNSPSTERADNTKAFAERLIAWASVAYGCGFVIVLLHTARMGIPVLDLVKPIYVWIGLPVAIVAFFARQILRWLRSRASANKAELLVAFRSDQHYVIEDDPLKVSAKLIDAVAYITPWYLPREPVKRFYQSILKRIFDRVGSRSDRAKVARLLDLYARGFRAAGAALNLLSLAVQAALGIALILFYVWFFYPLIPQAYGGGAPTDVRLLIDTSKLPPGLPHLTTPRQPQEVQPLPSITATVKLLYLTSASYWIRTPDERIIALDKSVVIGILYDSKVPNKP